MLRVLLNELRTQVVSVKIPPSKLPEFSKAYFDMFVRYDNGAGRIFMDRRDPQVRVVDSSVVGGVVADAVYCFVANMFPTSARRVTC